MNKYDYARDWRTPEKYKADFDRGTHNQLLAMGQFVIDKMMLNPQNKYGFEPVPDKDFQGEEGSWVYRPDYIMKVNDEQFPIEVKVQITEVGDELDIKCSQVDKLARLEGYILYTTPTHYSVSKPIKWQARGKKVLSERFGGKEVYRLTPDDLDWSLWIHSPPFELYYKGDN